jgi:hypothetical protein
LVAEVTSPLVVVPADVVAVLDEDGVVAEAEAESDPVVEAPELAAAPSQLGFGPRQPPAAANSTMIDFLDSPTANSGTSP